MDLLEEGIAHLRQERYAEAIQCLEAVLESDPQNEQALLYLGQAHMKLRDYPAAEGYARRLVELLPDNATAWCNLGVVLRKLKRFEEAKEAQEKALVLEPGHEKAQSELRKTRRDMSRRTKEEGGLLGVESVLDTPVDIPPPPLQDVGKPTPPPPTPPATRKPLSTLGIIAVVVVAAIIGWAVLSSVTTPRKAIIERAIRSALEAQQVSVEKLELGPDIPAPKLKGRACGLICCNLEVSGRNIDPLSVSRIVATEYFKRGSMRWISVSIDTRPLSPSFTYDWIEGAGLVTWEVYYDESNPNTPTKDDILWSLGKPEKRAVKFAFEVWTYRQDGGTTMVNFRHADNAFVEPEEVGKVYYMAWDRELSSWIHFVD